LYVVARSEPEVTTVTRSEAVGAEGDDAVTKKENQS
jgi:hypothetical protein